jgi:hypothetical protein
MLWCVCEDGCTRQSGIELQSWQYGEVISLYQLVDDMDKWNSEECETKRKGILGVDDIKNLKPFHNFCSFNFFKTK